MGLFILRRLGVMILTALCLTFVVFFLTNLGPNLEKLAKTQGNQRMTDEQVTKWLDTRGYLEPLPIKYAEWLGLWPGFVNTTEDGKQVGRCVTPNVHPRRHAPAIAACCRATGVTAPSSRIRQAGSSVSASP